jgi:hypothetical protein
MPNHTFRIHAASHADRDFDRTVSIRIGFHCWGLLLTSPLLERFVMGPNKLNEKMRVCSTI